jgi:hypothetical protein
VDEKERGRLKAKIFPNFDSTGGNKNNQRRADRRRQSPENRTCVKSENAENNRDANQQGQRAPLLRFRHVLMINPISGRLRNTG